MSATMAMHAEKQENSSNRRRFCVWSCISEIERIINFFKKNYHSIRIADAFSTGTQHQDGSQ